jgi:hydrogenase nickel incorporation protein HypA/HybF
MHELSVCLGLIGKVESIAMQHNARAVDRIIVRIGPLSGVEIPLLRQAYTLACAGTIAENAELVTETQAVRVTCETCGVVSDAQINRLVCGACGDYRTRLVSGDEMILESVELDLNINDATRDVM